MEIFHHLKFLNWCAQKYSNYTKYLSSNFSSLVGIYFAPASLLSRAGRGEEPNRAGIRHQYVSTID